jgi:hypothetical protein
VQTRDVVGAARVEVALDGADCRETVARGVQAESASSNASENVFMGRRRS